MTLNQGSVRFLSRLELTAVEGSAGRGMIRANGLVTPEDFVTRPLNFPIQPALAVGAVRACQLSGLTLKLPLVSNIAWIMI